jgi:hypothetical protein
MSTEKRREKAERVLKSMMGKAPVVTQDEYKLKLIKAFNYHNEFTDDKEFRKIVVNYLKQNGKKDYLPSVDAVSDFELRQIGILISHLQKGDYIAPKDQLLIESKLESIKSKHKEPTQVVAVVSEKKVVDKVLDQARILAASIDGEIDALFTKTSKGEFSPDTFLKSNNATEAVCRRVAGFYQKQVDEMRALVGGDADLKEAYSITKPHAKRMVAFLENVIDSCMQNAATIKAQKVRKPRTKKKKSPQVLVAKLQYLKEYPDLKLKSIDPKEVIGAKQLWLYNVKYKRLSKLVSDSTDGFTVKGTTILGINIAESECKRVRKPEGMFGEISKKALTFHLKKLKTTAYEVNGRVNKDTILLTV